MSSLSRLWALRDDRPMFVTVAIVTLVALLVYPFADWWLRSAGIAAGYSYGDYGAFTGAVDRWQHGEPLYRRGADGGFHGAYLYPPVVVSLFFPFKQLNFADGVALWNLLSLGLLWLGLQLLVASLDYDLQWWERGGLLWLVLGFHPVLLSMKLGQISLFLGGLLCLSAVALRRGETGSRDLRYVSGVYTAIVGTIKLSYAPVGAHLLQDRDRLLGAVATGLVLVVASILLAGVETMRTYLDVLVWGFGQGTGSRPPTLWLPPYYRPLHWLPASQLIRVAASIAVAAAAFLVADGDDIAVFALGVTAFPLLTPHGYTYYFVALLPAILVLLAIELDRDGDPTVPIAGLLFLHLHAMGLKFVIDNVASLFPPLEIFAPYWLLQPGLWGNLLVFGLAVVRVAEGIPLLASVADTRRGWTDR